MRTSENMLIHALAAAMRGRQVDWDEPVSQVVWEELIFQAREQKVLPMLLNAAYPCKAFRALEPRVQKGLKQEVTRQVVGQTRRTMALARLTKAAKEKGLTMLVMKGAACRGLYPNPDERPSADEDLLVPGAEFARWVEFLQEQGYRTQKDNCNPEQDFEIGFLAPDAYLELHRTPFDPESDVLSVFNNFFDAAHLRAMSLTVEGVDIAVLGPHDHMLYLILHAFKHLIHSGFGLRQVCDMVLWAETYGGEIDWPLLKKQCDTVRCWPFAAAALEMGRRWFGLDVEKAAIPRQLLWEDAPCEALIQDMLSGGIYGGTSRGRQHSSTITLRAVEAHWTGKKHSLLQTLFPSRSYLEGAYPYLERWPVLLPLAWGQRILRYGAELGRDNDVKNSPTESIRIGNARKELLKQLDIID